MNKVLLFVILFFAMNFVSGQSIDDFRFPEINFPSTNVRDLGRFGDYSHNLSIGQTNISVPIFTIPLGKVNYPISINYNHAGIKVDEKSGIVGMNWSLLGQGVISRIVNGKPDEDPSFGYYTKYNYVQGKALYTPTGNNDPYFLGAIGMYDLEPDYFVYSFNGKTGSFFYDPRDGKYYSMPFSPLKIRSIGSFDSFEIIDEMGFVYEFNESTKTSSNSESIGSGESTFSEEYKSQWYLTKIKNPLGLSIFEIKYQDNVLDIDQRTTETAVYNLSTSGSCSVSGAGYLVQRRTNRTYFSTNVYEKLPSKFIWSSGEIGFNYSSQPNGKLKLDNIQLRDKTSILKNWQFYYSSYVGTDKIKLDSLVETGDQRHGHVFTYNTDQIAVYQSNSQDYWGYFNGAINSSLIPKVRYDFRSIGYADREPAFNTTEAGILTAITYPTKGKTEFDYELNTYGLTTPDPIYGSYLTPTIRRKQSKDGSGTTSSEVFQITETSVVKYTSYRDNCDDRKPGCSFEPCQVMITITGDGKEYGINGARGVLKYGEVVLSPGTYQLNVSTSDGLDYGEAYVIYPAIVGYTSVKNSGGLRISKISNFDANGNKIGTKEFEYKAKDNPDRSSGISITAKHYMMTLQNGISCGGSLPNCSSWSNDLYLSSFSHVNMFYSGGYTTAYKRVLEHTTDVNNVKLTTEHIFSYDSDVSVTTYPYSGVSSRAWRRGLPLETNYYDTDGKKIKSVTNEYLVEPSLNLRKLPGVKLGFLKSCAHDFNQMRIASGYYNLHSEWIHPTKSTQKEYVYNAEVLQDSIVEITSYYYDNPNHGQLSRTVRTNERDHEILQFVSFIDDYPSGNTMIDNLKNNHIIAAPIEHVSLVKKGTDYFVAGGETFKYKLSGNGLIEHLAKINTVSPISLGQFKFSNRAIGVVPPTGTVEGYSLDQSYKIENVIDLYDSYGNPLSMKKAENPVTTYLWGYAGQYPIAEIKNATYTEVLTVLSQAEIDALNNPVHTESTMETLINNAVTKLRNHANLSKAMITSYTYRPLVGMTSKTDPRGVKETYKYDGMQRLQAILDHIGHVTKAIDYHYRPN